MYTRRFMALARPLIKAKIIQQSQSLIQISKGVMVVAFETQATENSEETDGLDY